METIKISKEQKDEFKTLDAEFNQREQVILQKWHKEHPYLIRGECNTPEMKTLRREYKKRYFAIVEKYKDKDVKN